MPVLVSQEFRQRLDRARHGTTVEQIFGRVRAIVGPAREQTVRDALAAMENGRALSSAEMAALETLIRLMRPSPLCRNGEVTDLDPGTAGAFPNWDRFRSTIRPHLYCVGRIDSLDPDPNLRGPVGTGFLVTDSLLVTNRHVLDRLSRATRVLDPWQAQVWFRREYGQPPETPEEPVPILEVVGYAQAVDLAVLRVASQVLDDRRRQLTLSDAPAAVGDAVAAVGYPSNDTRRNPAFVPALFGDRFGVKRCAPGEVTRFAARGFEHDCSTLGGNSGSPLFSMVSGKVVGVHYDGTFLYTNKGIDAASVGEVLDPYLR